MAVGGWVVTAASYEAKAFGVGSGMGGAKARSLCPDLVVVPPRWPAYVEASRAVFDVFRRTSPLVEGLSIDEAFLDVRGMTRSAGTPLEIAEGLRETVREETGLAITVGIATTKSLAKIASALAKPDGLMLVPPEYEMVLLHGLRIERLWGVGPATARRLHARGIERVGQIARLGEDELAAILGRAGGRHLHALAHNRDPRPVHAGRRRRSFGAQSALGTRPRSAAGARHRAGGAGQPAHAPHAHAPTGAGARSCSACASATTRPPPARARCGGRRPPRRPCSPPCGSCWRRQAPRSASAASPCSA